jgi:hypothetical protein
MAYSATATCKLILWSKPDARADEKSAAEPCRARPHVFTAKGKMNAMKTTQGTMEMTGAEYRAALVRLGVARAAADLSETARFFSIRDRAGSRAWGTKFRCSVWLWFDAPTKKNVLRAHGASLRPTRKFTENGNSIK